LVKGGFFMLPSDARSSWPEIDQWYCYKTMDDLSDIELKKLEKKLLDTLETKKTKVYSLNLLNSWLFNCRKIKQKRLYI
tara:strand:- start:404 stop:640 length:237 start_codon:yes stop_codon:yes gene_type:complete